MKACLQPVLSRALCRIIGFPPFFWMFMEILFLLIPISVVLIVAAVCAFYWAVRSRQFDDLESPGMIPLLDDSEEERRQREDASQ